MRSAQHEAGHPSRSWTTVALAVLSMVISVGCSGPNGTIVATDAVFPPFHFVDESGRLTGFDVQTVQAALRRTGHQVHVVRAESFAELFEGLEREQYDVLAATTGITLDRLGRYEMTRPYFITCLAVLVRKGPDEPRAPAELVGRRIAAAAGTTSAAAAKRIEGATVIETTRKLDSLAALRAGEVDAIIIDEFEAVPFARDEDDLEVLGEPADIESYGFVLRRSDAALRMQLDTAITAMEADGTLATLRKRFGLDRPAGWPVELAPDTDE